MAGDRRSYVERQACRCEEGPDKCVADEELLTQHTWKAGIFNDAPRDEPAERELSMLRGDVTVAEACEYRSSTKVPAAKVAKAGRRQTTAAEVRAAGFAVVHTPGWIKNGLHVSIVWPSDDPVHAQRVPWPPEVSKKFAACFNESRGE